jgi:hypothetical protein
MRIQQAQWVLWEFNKHNECYENSNRSMEQHSWISHFKAPTNDCVKWIWKLCLKLQNVLLQHEIKNNNKKGTIKKQKKTNEVFEFKGCNSVHHRTIQINHQPDATIFQFIILTFIYSSTCFGRFPAHHKELNNCSGSLLFYLRFVVTVELLMMGGKAPETCSTVNKLQDNKPENCCIWLVIYLNCKSSKLETFQHEVHTLFVPQENTLSALQITDFLWDINARYSEKHTKHTNAFCWQKIWMSCS